MTELNSLRHAVFGFHSGILAYGGLRIGDMGLPLLHPC